MVQFPWVNGNAESISTCTSSVSFQFSDFLSISFYPTSSQLFHFPSPFNSLPEFHDNNLLFVLFSPWISENTNAWIAISSNSIRRLFRGALFRISYLLSSKYTCCLLSSEETLIFFLCCSGNTSSEALAMLIRWFNSTNSLLLLQVGSFFSSYITYLDFTEILS